MKTLLNYCKRKNVTPTTPKAPLGRLPLYALEYKYPWAWAEILNLLDMVPSSIGSPTVKDVHYLRMLEKHYNFRLFDQAHALRIKEGSILEGVLEKLKEIEEEVTPLLFQNDEGLWESIIYAQYDEYDLYSELSEELGIECTHCDYNEELDNLSHITPFSDHTNIYHCGMCGKWFRNTPKPLGEIQGAVWDRIEFHTEIAAECFRDEVRDWMDTLEDKGFEAMKIGSVVIDLNHQDFIYETAKYHHYNYSCTLYKDGTADYGGREKAQAGYACEITGDFISQEEYEEAKKRARVVNILEGQEFYNHLGEYSFENSVITLSGRYANLIESMGIGWFSEEAAKNLMVLMDEDWSNSHE